MAHPYLIEARGLFERSDNETDPSRKFAALEEALEIVDFVLEDSILSRSDKELAVNLRYSNIRSLLSQLVGMRSIQIVDWFNYIDLLVMRHQHEVESVFNDDPSLKEGYKVFLAIHKGELIELLENT